MMFHPRCSLAALLVLFCFAFVALAPASADDAESSETAKRKYTYKGRLPAYYKEVVTDEQKEKIYAIQMKYYEEIRSLKDKLLALVKQQSAEIEAVLTEAQKTQIEQLRAQAKAEREAKEKAAEE